MTPPRFLDACGWIMRRLGVLVGVSAILVGAVPPAGSEPLRGRFILWNDATPALALSDVAGHPHTLADYRGQVLLVNFWATWCEPCREEMPSMQKLRQRFADQPFAILAVNYGESTARSPTS